MTGISLNHLLHHTYVPCSLVRYTVYFPKLPVERTDRNKCFSIKSALKNCTISFSGKFSPVFPGIEVESAPGLIDFRNFGEFSSQLNLHIRFSLFFFVDAETITMEIELTLNGTSVPWNIKFVNHRSREFKQLALNVKNKLREVLSKQQGISEIKIKEFKEKHGNTSCVVDCKVTSAVVEKEDIEKVLNGTVDIGVIAPVAYAAIKMSLKLSRVSWIDSFDDQNSTAYKNLTRRIKDALSDVYQSKDDVVGFEINSLMKTFDGSVLLEYLVVVYPDSKLMKKDLENTFNEFTKNNSFGGMIAENHPAKEEESESDGAVNGLVVMGALIMCVVIIAFIIRVS